MKKEKKKFNIDKFLKKHLGNNYGYLILVIIILSILSIKDIKYLSISLLIGLIILIYERKNYLRLEKKRKQEKLEYTNDLNIVTQNIIINSPIPLIIAETSGKILWKSKKFSEVFDGKLTLSKIENLIHILKMDIEKDENKNVEILKKITVENRIYEVYGQYSRSKRSNIKNQNEYVITLQFIDITNSINIYEKYEKEKLAFGFITIDNFEETIEKIPIVEKPRILSEIERIIYEFVTEFKGIFIKTNEDEFIVLFENSKIEEIKEQKFEVLEKVKSINLQNNQVATLSIAIASNKEGLNKTYKSAVDLMDVVLKRGGDQAAISYNSEIKFFGGKTKETEILNKVKARVMSNMITNEAKLASNIIIMGHSNIDIDALGSAIGMYKLLKEYNDNVYIASDCNSSGLGEFKNILKENEEYQKVILNKVEALNKINLSTLLIIVDVHRQQFCEFPELVDKVENIVIIDHHRKLIDHIEKAKIIYQEVYASSASELVTELIEYSEKKVPLTVFEAEALYGGILIDTKNFTFKTGVRTFEAAAYLRKYGVDIVKVKKWFEGNLESYMNIYEIIKNSKMYENNIAVATTTEESADINLKCAKAADQMLNIGNIEGSIVIGSDSKKIYICLRSTGNINMQIIAEKLGGGGHLTLAGAQFDKENNTIEDVLNKVENVINEYNEEIN